MELVKQTTQQTLDSREVASMVEKPHNDLLKDIRKYIQYLGEGNFPQSDFFTESTYQNTQNKTQPCYNITKKGCEFIAHKLTGQKGAVFTATYINRFHELEQGQALPKLSKEIQAIFVLDQKQQKFETRLDTLENNTTIDFGQQRNLQVLAQKTVLRIIGGKETPAYRDKPIRSKVFSSLWKDYKDYMQVASYRDTLKIDYNRAVSYIANWRLNGKLLREVEECNSQMELVI